MTSNEPNATAPERLMRILKTRLKFMRIPWENVDTEILKTKVRIRFYRLREIDGEMYTDFRTIEYGLNKSFTLDNVIADQQRKLGRDMINFVGKDSMDEVREVFQ
jgi:hypothetical protein